MVAAWSSGPQWRSVLKGALVSSWALLAAEADLFEELGCTEHAEGGGEWIWGLGTGEWPSCQGPVRGDGASMCIGPDGKPDFTSIRVNMNGLSDKTGCFVWEASTCTLDLRTVSRLEFDFELGPACVDVWSAALWLAPDPWEPPAGLSGEIDFVENCPVGQMSTNFAGCLGTDEGQCQQYVWPSGWLQGAKHFVMTLEDSDDLSSGGTLRTYVCDLGGDNCERAGVYHDFLGSVVATKDRETGYSYTLRSDIWNGHGGDSGWAMCGGTSNPDTGCEYAIRNIRITNNDRAPHHHLDGTCAVLTSPVPAPSEPTPSSSSCSALACGAYVPEQGCQCNPECAQHSNCCPDYESVCVAVLADSPGAPGGDKKELSRHGVPVVIACLLLVALVVGACALLYRYKSGLQSSPPASFLQRAWARATEPSSANAESTPLARTTSWMGGSVETSPLVQRERAQTDQSARGWLTSPASSPGKPASPLSGILGLGAESPPRR